MNKDNMLHLINDKLDKILKSKYKRTKVKSSVYAFAIDDTPPNHPRPYNRA